MALPRRLEAAVEVQRLVRREPGAVVKLGHGPAAVQHWDCCSMEAEVTQAWETRQGAAVRRSSKFLKRRRFAGLRRFREGSQPGRTGWRR